MKDPLEVARAKQLVRLVEGLVLERDRLESLDQLNADLETVTDILVTTGHPEFGIECTLAVDDRSITVINQPDVFTALRTAFTQLSHDAR